MAGFLNEAMRHWHQSCEELTPWPLTSGAADLLPLQQFLITLMELSLRSDKLNINTHVALQMLQIPDTLMPVMIQSVLFYKQKRIVFFLCHVKLAMSAFLIADVANNGSSSLAENVSFFSHPLYM